ncbi:MAG: hypothetical protein R2755_16920 [Acidimicrobiales bacterium]
MGNGLWVGPAHRCDAVLAAVALDARPGEVDVFSGVYLGQPRALVQRAWDLEITQTMAAAFVPAEPGPAAAQALDRRRRLRGLHAGPAPVAHGAAAGSGPAARGAARPWAAEQAADVFLELRDRLEAPAVRYVQAVTTSG